jgi:hypothetical protein
MKFFQYGDKSEYYLNLDKILSIEPTSGINIKIMTVTLEGGSLKHLNERDGKRLLNTISHYMREAE